MQPQVDLDFLAEASPRSDLLLAAKPPPYHCSPLFQPRLIPTGSEDLSFFINSSLRCMRYRAFVRWYHGPFLAKASATRLLSNFLLALLTLFAFYTFLCIDDESSSATASGAANSAQQMFESEVELRHLFEPVDFVFFSRYWKWTLTISAAVMISSLVVYLTCSQTARVAPLSVLLSRATILTVAVSALTLFIQQRGTLIPPFSSAQCPLIWPTQMLPITLGIFTAGHSLLSLIILFIEYAASPLARWYLLRSSFAVAHCQATVLESRRDKLTIRACPFGCQGKTTFWKTVAHFFHFIRFRRNIYFAPTEAYLPNGLSSTPVLPCCPFCSLYVGQVDSQLRPHGMGVWQEGWGRRHGEYLNGCWEFGRPIAPFLSRQNNCGSGFTALRFGWVRFEFITKESVDQVYHNHDNGESNECLEESNFEFGLLDVECSVFGKFFRKFPKFIYWKFPESEIPVNRQISRLRPKLGLNNRMSSFSYLDSEPTTNRHSRRTTQMKEGLSIATRMLTRTASSRSVEMISSKSFQAPLVEDIKGSEESEYTYTRCSEKLRWVLNRMLPFHIPVSHGEEAANDELRISLSPNRGLVPHGWNKIVPRRRVSWKHFAGMTPVDEDSEESGTSQSDNSPEASPWIVSNLLIEIMEQRRNVQAFGASPSTLSILDSRDVRGREISVNGWRKFTEENVATEAMVFIHGYKTPLNEAPLLLGQLIALGAFPNRIKPFMFLWPAGVKVWHYYQARRASHHYLCQKGLVLFLKTLAHRGIKSIHILAHSMGSRLFMNSIKYAMTEDIFVHNSEKVDGVNRGGVRSKKGLLDLVNLIFIHPEHYLDDFVVGGGYEQVKAYASHTTIYCHSNDEALASAELLSRGRRCMGRHPFGYIRPVETCNIWCPHRCSAEPRQLSGGALTTTCSEGGEIDRFRMSTRQYNSSDEIKATQTWLNNTSSDHTRTCSTAPAIMTTPRTFPNSLNRSSKVSRNAFEWLEVDVIDCTYLDANVHGLRHCFFNINASVVGDLRELIAERVKASQRHKTLERRDGNVYTFRTPPAELISIFGL